VLEATGAGPTANFTDAELTQLALAAKPDPRLDPDAVPLLLHGGAVPGLLRSWYMPPAMARPRRGWRLPAVIVIVAVLLTLEVLGLCSVFGQVIVG
jgi:hypothetical protein